jgi:hypothetical protein
MSSMCIHKSELEELKSQLENSQAHVAALLALRDTRDAVSNASLYNKYIREDEARAANGIATAYRAIKTAISTATIYAALAKKTADETIQAFAAGTKTASDVAKATKDAWDAAFDKETTFAIMTYETENYGRIAKQFLHYTHTDEDTTWEERFNKAEEEWDIAEEETKVAKATAEAYSIINQKV